MSTPYNQFDQNEQRNSMNDSKTADRESRVHSSDTKIGLINILIALARHKMLVILLPFATAVIAALISTVLPNAYKANTKLLPPQQAQSSASTILSQLGGVAGLGAGIAGLKSPNDLYIGMLRSRAVADRIIARFDLKKLYETPSQETARKYLEENTVINSGKDGLIVIEVEDKNQKLVADLANAYVDELLRLTRTLAVTEASQRRLFFEQQLEMAKNNLAKAEVSLKSSMDSRGVISVDSESRAIVETVARLKAQISAKEIELNSMRAFLTPTHPDFKRVQEELNSLNVELSKLQNGRGNVETAEPTQSKHGGLENIQLLRDLKYNQMLYELLAKQYEIARMDEAKDPSVIQVLDRAVAPERKFKPKRAVIVIMSTFVAFLMALFLVMFIELKRKALSSPDVANGWREFKSSLRFR
jgi:tyrosine-protein kinase Etk/Wzc